MLDNLTNNFDKHLQTEMILLDFSKAFDSISHNILEFVLNQIHIDANTLKWIKYLLSSRTQQTIVDGQLSEEIRVRSGVPQGSVIAPQLFNIYVNILLRKLQSCDDVTALAFADDLKLVSSNPSKLQHALSITEDWCKKFKLKLNPDKSEHLCFREQTSATFFICSEPIKKVVQTKDIGITVTTDLKWKTEVSIISAKATSLCYVILWALTCTTVEPYVKAYKSFVRPSLEFSTVIWNSCQLTEIRSLEKVQRLFTRKVLQRLNIRYDSYDDRLEILQLQRLEMRRLHSDLITVYKILTNMIDLSFDNFFTPIPTTYNLRRHSITLLYPPRPKSNVQQNSFKYRVIKAWNSLSEDTVKANTLNTFKSHLKSANLNRFLRDTV